MNHETLSQAATIARGLAIDAVHACSSGHLGLPLGAAEVGAVLFGHALNFNPDDPRWLNRDRFILSAGHGSMFLYSWLHLSGYELPLQEIKDFRQLHSATPGHPEFAETPGVEATTGPLGQGVGNAVGYAISGKMLADRFSKDLFNYHVVALAGDGCLQEGVASEAAALAGHLGLDNLILIYDSNDVTLDAMADVTQSEDTAKRFEAYGFDVVTVDGHDLNAFLTAFEQAKSDDNGKPKLLIARTEIGRGIPEVAGTAKAHGEGGAKFAAEARKGLGLPDEPFYVSSEVRDYFAQHKAELVDRYESWQALYKEWAAANPEQAQMLQDGVDGKVPVRLARIVFPPLTQTTRTPTRGAGGVVIQAVAKEIPMLFTGSADLFGSTKNYIKDEGDFGRENYSGRNVWFGIREHAMGAIMNGRRIRRYLSRNRSDVHCFCGLSPAVDSPRPRWLICPSSTSSRTTRLVSVKMVRRINRWRPVVVCESSRTWTCSGPGIREEVAGAFASAVQRTDGPTALLLSRQKVPTLSDIPVNVRREGADRGGYVAMKETGDLKMIVMATGSELQLALAAAGELGDGVRVVSMPCFERFDRQDRGIPPTGPARFLQTACCH